MAKYINVKVYKRSIHRNCMKGSCNTEATVTGSRRTGTTVMDVRYCKEHAKEGGLIK